MSIPFRAIGVNYLDPILIKEFNNTVVTFAASMSNGNRNSMMVKVSKLLNYPPYGNIGDLLLNVLNNKLYPRIDPTTMEIEWWAHKHVFQDAINELKTQKVI